MRCEQVQEGLHAYLDGELRPRARARIETHVESCRNCRRALAAARQLAALLEETPAPPVPEGFAGRVMAQARERAAGDRRLFRPSWNPFLWWTSMSVPMRAAAAVVLIVGLAAGILMARETWQAPAAKSVASRTAPTDPVAIYGLDYLTECPDTSLTDVYLGLASAQNGRGE